MIWRNGRFLGVAFVANAAESANGLVTTIAQAMYPCVYRKLHPF
jgi:hypothetical protein